MGCGALYEEPDEPASPSSPCSDADSALEQELGRKGGAGREFSPWKHSNGPGWSAAIRQTRRGFRCQCEATALLPIPPDQAWELLCEPEPRPWRHIKECTFRAVREDDGNRQLVEVEQTAQVLFKVVRTRLLVAQDRREGVQSFSLAQKGALRDFHGSWTVRPVEGQPECSSVRLEQEMEPAFTPPPPFKRFMRRALLGKAAHMLQDMQEEARRIQALTLGPLAPPTPALPLAAVLSSQAPVGCYQLDFNSDEDEP